MIPIMEFQRRSVTGPVMQADDFDLEFAMKIRDLVRDYEIRYDPTQLIVDDRTADAVFEAGLDLLAAVGLYHMETRRVIRYERDELVEVARESRETPANVTLGRGRDTMTLRHRRGSDAWAPTNYAGAPTVADEAWFVEYVQSFVQEPSVAGIGIPPGLARLGNIEPKAGTLSEVTVGLWEQAALKEALRRAGRPDLNLGLLGTVSTFGATLAMMGPDLREAWNTQIGIHILPEQKLDWSRLLLTQYCQNRSIEPWQSAMSCIGGLCRDAADTAVGMVANALGQMSYAGGATMSYFPSHLDGSWATRDSHWAFSAAARASERHLGLAVGSSISGIVPSWRTPLSLLQSAAIVAVYVPSGLAYSWISGHTGLEARLINEMMEAVTRKSAGQANELAQRIMRRVDELLPTAREQVPFPQAYDLATVTPDPAYELSMLRARDELAALGMSYR